MPDPGYLTLALAIAVAITVSLRTLPFLIRKPIQDSAVLADFGHWMPLGAVAILAIYSIAHTDFQSASHGIPQLTAIAVTAGIHLWKHNAALSIATGTTTCVTLSLILPI